jgi:superfamily II DNA or RNA helicase
MTQAYKPIVLRDYQVKGVNVSRETFKAGKKKFLIVSPTGTGKGTLIAFLMNSAVTKGNQVLFAVHRTLIVEDVAQRLQASGVYASLVLPGFRPSSEDKALVGSIQSINSRVANGSLDPKQIKIIFIDEAHYFNPKEGMYKTLTENFPEAIVIGFTATPCRPGGQTLATFFEEMIQLLTFKEAWDEGWLVRPRYFAPQTPDLSEVTTVAGDYNQGQTDQIMSQPEIVGNVVEHYARHGQGRQSVLFAPKRASARAFQKKFLEAGFVAEYVDGMTPKEERERIFESMKRGEVNVLCSVDVATEGYDEPRVSCIIWCCPTKSIRKWIQGLGRGLRLFDGKEDCLVLDHTGTLNNLGFLEEYNEWVLNAPDDKAVKRKTSTKKIKEAIQIVCENCAQIFTHARVCPKCGWVLPPSSVTEEMLEDDAELVEKEFRRKQKKLEYTEEEKRLWYSMLLTYARTKILKPVTDPSTGKPMTNRIGEPITMLEARHKDGWAYHKYKEKFNVFPVSTRSAQNIQPNGEVLAWLDSRKKKWLYSAEGKEWSARQKTTEATGQKSAKLIQYPELQALFKKGETP